jgi:peptidyl-prolyl cis-trans isomerase B (cyclophilin B)
MKTCIALCIGVLACGFAATRAQDTKSESKVKADDKQPPAKPVAQTANTNEVAVIKTSDGQMVVEFWPDVAPKTVENFKSLAKKGFYDGTCFHRIVKGFMVQGGDPLTKESGQAGNWGTGGPGYALKAEFNRRSHELGVLSMARGGDPDSAGSQFFICDAPPDNPSMQYLNGKYTAFGKLIKGQDVLEKIAATPVTMNPMGELSKPTARVEVQSIRIVPADSVK